MGGKNRSEEHLIRLGKEHSQERGCRKHEADQKSVRCADTADHGGEDVPQGQRRIGKRTVEAESLLPEGAGTLPANTPLPAASRIAATITAKTRLEQADGPVFPDGDKGACAIPVPCALELHRPVLDSAFPQSGCKETVEPVESPIARKVGAFRARRTDQALVIHAGTAATRPNAGSAPLASTVSPFPFVPPIQAIRIRKAFP